MKNSQATRSGFHRNADALQRSFNNSPLAVLQAAGPALPGGQWPIQVMLALSAAYTVVPSALLKGRCLPTPQQGLALLFCPRSSSLPSPSCLLSLCSSTATPARTPRVIW